MMTITLQDTAYPSSFAEHVARLPEVSYADTAFKGDFDDSPPKHSHRFIKGHLENHTHCHEYLALNRSYEVGDLQDWKKEYCEPWTEGTARYRDKEYRNNSSDMPAALHFYGISFSIETLVGVLHTLAIIGTYVVVGSPILGVIWFGFGWLIDVLTTPSMVAIYSIPPLLLWLVLLLRKSGLPEKYSTPPKPYLSFHRDTGMVTIQTGKHRSTVPFREFQGTGFTLITPNTFGKRIAFGIKHKHSSAWARMEGALSAAFPMNRWHLNVRWELLTHYMDVTRPLPDIPIFEPFRHLDPTTKAWDKEHQRPETVWLNMPEDEYRSLVKAAINSADVYPVKPKSHNINSDENWKPAGDGKHWYQLG